MIKLYLLLLFFSFQLYGANIYVHRNLLFKEVPYSDQYISKGALIKSVDFRSVNDIKIQIERALRVRLKDRNEAHITIITPPEFNGNKKDKIGIGNALSINDIHKLFLERNLQKFYFRLYPCIGERKEIDESGKIVKRVFYLIIKAPYLFTFRQEIASLYKREAEKQKIPYKFDPLSFYPHITIGFQGGDIHDQSKGPESCTEEDLQLILPQF